MAANRKSVNRTSKFDFSQSAPTHFTSDTEIAAYVNWINTQLQRDPDLTGYLPLSAASQTDLFNACSDGVLLCKLINNSVPDTINEKQLTKNAKSQIHKIENLHKALAGAIKIGVQVHNLSAEDVLKGTPHLVLGLVWQVIKVGLLQNINPTGAESPNASANDIASKAVDPSTQSLEKGLLKWVNGTLKKLNVNLRVTNFGQDLSDSVALVYLISSFDSESHGAQTAQQILNEHDITKRAELVLEYAAKFDCRHFASAADIVGGNKNLNLAFVAVLHNLKVSRDKAQQVRIQLEGAKDDAEAALLRVANNRDVEVKKLRLQLEDAKEEVERLCNARDALQNAYDELQEQAEEQAAAWEEHEQLAERLERLAHLLQLNEQKYREQSEKVLLLQTELAVYRRRVEDLETSNQRYREKLAAFGSNQLSDSLQSLSNLSAVPSNSLDILSNASNNKQNLQSFSSLQNLNQAPTNSLNNLSDRNQNFLSLENLPAPANSLDSLLVISAQDKQQAQYAQIYSQLQSQLQSQFQSRLQAEQQAQQQARQQDSRIQELQYKLLALQTESDEKSAELAAALQRADQAQQQLVQSSYESLASFVNSAELSSKQQQLVQSIDTLHEDMLLLSQLDSHEREARVAAQLGEMQTITVELMQLARANEVQVVQNVVKDLQEQDAELFEKVIQGRGQPVATQKDLLEVLALFVGQLNAKAENFEKKAEVLNASVDTLNAELQRAAVIAEQAQKQAQYRDADIDNVHSRQEAFDILQKERARLEERLAILNATTVAIMDQRSKLIAENKRLQESGESSNLSQQIKSLDHVLAENAKLKRELEADSAKVTDVDTEHQLKVQEYVDALYSSQDCLIENLNNLRESNEEMQERLENAQRCIAALMAQRSILLKERDELRSVKPTSKSQHALQEQQPNEGLSRSKQNSSFASAPNLAKRG